MRKPRERTRVEKPKRQCGETDFSDSFPSLFLVLRSTNTLNSSAAVGQLMMMMMLGGNRSNMKEIRAKTVRCLVCLLRWKDHYQCFLCKFCGEMYLIMKKSLQSLYGRLWELNKYK